MKYPVWFDSRHLHHPKVFVCLILKDLLTKTCLHEHAKGSSNSFLLILIMALKAIGFQKVPRVYEYSIIRSI